MNAFVVLALCVAGVAANGYGSAPSFRLESSSYSAPSLRTDSYGGGYGAVRSLIPITSFSHDIRGSLSDNLAYQTGNGISVKEDTQVVAGRGGAYDDGYGQLIQSDAVVVKQGSYSYISPEGIPITTTWVADENGFRAAGDHLPVPVAMPAEHAEAHRLALSGAGFGGYGAPALRSSYDAPAFRSSYDAPAIRVSSYEAPLIRSSYEAPVIRSSYEAPVIRSSYEAPVIRSSYDAPAIRVQSYEAPLIRSSYEAPVIRSSYDAPAIRVSSY